jgi:acyl-CoA synthetase (AMP-forming)/AMP-acid ligase II/acyl carrier protein
MKLTDVFNLLKQRNISIGIDDGKLKVIDAESNLDNKLIEMLKEHKPALIEVLSNRTKFSISDFPLAELSEEELEEIVHQTPLLSDIYAATAVQAGMLFEEHLSQQSGEYTLHYQSTVKEQLDTTRVKGALQALTAKHSILRTSFTGLETSQVKQVVLSEATVNVTEVDLLGQDNDARAESIDDYKAHQKTISFDFRKPPLLRCAVFNYDSEQFTMLWSFHHTILDGVGLHVLVADFWQAYENGGGDIETGALDTKPQPQFKNYIRWLAAQNKDESIKYWKDYLADASLQPCLHRSTGAPLLKEATVSTIHLPAISQEITKALSNVAREARTTLFTTMQLCWGLLLMQYAGRNDVLFGSPWSDRPSDLEGSEHIAGVMLNTVPTRVKFEANASLKACLQYLHKDSGEKYAHNYVSLQELHKLTDADIDGIFDTLFISHNYQSLTTGASEAANNSVKFLSGHVEQEYKNPCTVTWSVHNQELRISLQIRNDLFDDAFIARLQTRLYKVIDVVASASLEAPISELKAIFNRTETKKLSTESLSENTPMKGDVVTRFIEVAKNNPKAVAIRSCDEVVKYKDLDEKSNQLSNYLIEAGVSQGSTVAIAMEKKINLVVAILGVAKAGANFVLLDNNDPTNWNLKLLEKVGHGVAITEADIESYYPLEEINTILLDDRKTAKKISKQKKHAPDVTISFNTRFALQNTATNGNQDQALWVSHGNVLAMSDAALDNFKSDALSATLFSSAVSSPLSLFSIFAPLLIAGTVVLVEDIYEICFDDCLAPTMVTVTANEFQELKKRRFDLSGIACVNYLYDPFEHQNLASQLKDDKINLVMLDPRSTTFSFINTNVTELASVPDFALFGNAHGLVFDTDNLQQPLDAVGSLVISGNTVVDIENASTNTVDNSSEDLRMDNRCVKYYAYDVLAVARDNARYSLAHEALRHITKNSNMVSLNTVEDVLMAMEGVVNVNVIIRNDPGTKTRMVAYITMEESIGYKDDYSDNSLYYDRIAECKEWIQERLPKAFMPDNIVFLDEQPDTKGRALTSHYLPSPEELTRKMRKYVAPSDEYEKSIVSFWEKCFHIRDISVENDFFDLGGTSMQQMRIQANIKKEYGIDIAIEFLFEVSTPAEQARLVKERVRTTQQEAEKV